MSCTHPNTTVDPTPRPESNTMNRHALVATCLLLCALPLIAIAADPWLGQETTLPLRQLQGSPAPLELRGAEARAAVNLPVPARLELHSAELELIYTNSISMLPRSELAITLDERILAQLPLKSDQPDSAARLRLPVDSLKSGYHSLGFRTAQHYTNSCEDGSAPELFSQIDTRQSLIRIQSSPRPVPLSLAQLKDIFDSRLWLQQFPLSVISASDALLEAESLAVQGAALRLEFIPVAVERSLLHTEPALPAPSSSAPATGYFKQPPKLTSTTGDILLLGTRDQLAHTLSDTQLARIQGAYLGVLPLDSDPSRAVIILSGIDNDQVHQAARVFALNSFALPDRQDVAIGDLTIPQAYTRLIGGSSQVGSDDADWVPFARLDFVTSTLRGMYPRPAQLNFWAFSEMFDPRQRTLEAQLNLAYGAGFDKKSALNVLLNGQFIQAIHLNNPSGDQLWRVKLNIPIAQLQAGRNTLSFAPSVIGQDVGGECRPIFTENLYVSIANDSRIALPASGGFLRLPDLSMLARTALPYSQMIDGTDAALLVLGEDSATQSAALTLVGKLAQINKAPMLNLRVGLTQDSLGGAKNLLAVGDPDKLPAALLQEVDTFLPKLRWQALAVGTQISRAPLNVQGWLQNPAQSPLATQQNRVVSANLRLDSDLGNSAAAVQLPLASLGGTLTLFSAANAQKLQAAMQTLVGFETWGALNGNGMLWTAGGEPLAFSFPLRHHFVGEIAPTTKASLMLTERPMLLVGAALGIVLLTASITWWLLRRRAKRMKLE